MGLRLQGLLRVGTSRSGVLAAFSVLGHFLAPVLLLLASACCSFACGISSLEPAASRLVTMASSPFFSSMTRRLRGDQFTRPTRVASPRDAWETSDSQSTATLRARVDISWLEGELATVVSALTALPARSLFLVHGSKGRPITAGSLRTRFERARQAAGVDFQFRDLRAKAGTDAGNLADAQALLGHAAATTTDRYIRRRVGVVVRPVGRKL